MMKFTLIISAKHDKAGIIGLQLLKNGREIGLAVIEFINEHDDSGTSNDIPKTCTLVFQAANTLSPDQLIKLMQLLKRADASIIGIRYGAAEIEDDTKVVTHKVQSGKVIPFPSPQSMSHLRLTTGTEESND